MRLTIDTLEALCVHVSFGVTYLGHDCVVDKSKFPKEVVVLACVGREVSYVLVCWCVWVFVFVCIIWFWILEDGVFVYNIVLCLVNMVYVKWIR